MNRGWVRRALAFDPSQSWFPSPAVGPVQGEPLPWTRPPQWDTNERVALGLTSHGMVAFLSQASLLRLVTTDRAITGPRARVDGDA